MYGHLFPQLPHRTRLNRRLRAQQDWTGRFLAQPTVLGVADSYGIELRHPIREGRREGQIGKKGISNHRWILGGKLCVVQNQWGLITDWDCATANVKTRPSCLCSPTTTVNGMVCNRTKTDASIAPSLTSPSDTN